MGPDGLMVSVSGIRGRVGAGLTPEVVTTYAAAFGAKGIRVNSIDEFEGAVKQSLTEPGVTIIDALVDYSHNTELFAQLHHGVLE